MLNGTIKTHGHTCSEGKLDLHLDVGLPDTDVVVVAHVRPMPEASDLDENGWPKNFFETVAGSMLELRRWDQGQFEHRLPLE